MSANVNRNATPVLRKRVKNPHLMPNISYCVCVCVCVSSVLYVECGS